MVEEAAEDTRTCVTQRTLARVSPPLPALVVNTEISRSDVLFQYGNGESKFRHSEFQSGLLIQ